MQSERTRNRTGCDDVLVVLGGFGTQQSPIDNVEMFDPNTQSWTALPVKIFLLYNIFFIFYFKMKKSISVNTHEP